MKYKVKHITEYTYLQPTTIAYNEAWMFPRELPYQVIEKTGMSLTPTTEELRYRTDFFGNRVAFFSVQVPHEHFKIEVTTKLERRSPPNIAPENVSHLPWTNVAEELDRVESQEIVDIKGFILSSPVVHYSEDLKAYAAESFSKDRPFFEAVCELNHRIYEDFEYNTEFTTVATPLSEVIHSRKGVCQDFAHFAIGCLRSLRLPARYVSGYIETIPPEGEPQLVGSVASHAWFSTYIPGMGWVDIDPTNDQIV